MNTFTFKVRASILKTEEYCRLCYVGSDVFLNIIFFFDNLKAQEGTFD